MVDVDENGRPTKFDAKMTWVMSQVKDAEIRKAVGKAVVNIKELFICYDEESLAGRMERVRGAGTLSQTERVVVVTSPGIVFEI